MEFKMILVGGENLMDMVEIGDNANNRLFEAIPGGSPYNVAMAIGRQGQKVGYLTPISTDGNGEKLVNKLKASNVEVLGERSSAATSLAIVTVKDGVPSYSFYRDRTAERFINKGNLEKYLTKDVKVFHIGSLALTEAFDADIWEEFSQVCKSKGIKISLDPNVRASLISNPSQYRSRIKRLMKIANILKLSDEDLNWLFNYKSEQKSLEEVISISDADLLVLTRGSNGSSFWHDKTWHNHPAEYILSITDSVGAGDTFMASLIAWLCKNEMLHKIKNLTLANKNELVLFASKAAALNCQQSGCNPPWAKDLF